MKFILLLLTLAPIMRAVPITRCFTFTHIVGIEGDEPYPQSFAFSEEVSTFSFDANFASITDDTPLTVDSSQFNSCDWGSCTAEVKNGVSEGFSTLLDQPPYDSQGMTVVLMANGKRDVYLFPFIDAQFLAWVDPAIEVQTYYGYDMWGNDGMWQMDVAEGAVSAAPEPNYELIWFLFLSALIVVQRIGSR